MKYKGKQVFRVRTEDESIEYVGEEYKNRWIFSHTLDENKTTVMENVHNNFNNLHVPVALFETVMQAHFIGSKSDEEDIL